MQTPLFWTNTHPDRTRGAGVVGTDREEEVETLGLSSCLLPSPSRVLTLPPACRRDPDRGPSSSVSPPGSSSQRVWSPLGLCGWVPGERTPSTCRCSISVVSPSWTFSWRLQSKRGQGCPTPKGRKVSLDPLSEEGTLGHTGPRTKQWPASGRTVSTRECKSEIRKEENLRPVLDNLIKVLGDYPTAGRESFRH